MSVTKKRVESALEGIEFLSISQYHTDNQDVWKLEAITDKEIELLSYRYKAKARLPFESFSDKKTIEQLKASILQTFSIFVSGFESGAKITQSRIAGADIFALPTIQQNKEKQNEQQTN